MPRNEFAYSEYICPRCELGIHDMCNEPTVCKCDHTAPAGKPEDEDLSQELPLIEEPEQEVGSPSLADLRKEPGFTTTEAHRKTGQI